MGSSSSTTPDRAAPRTSDGVAPAPGTPVPDIGHVIDEADLRSALQTWRLPEPVTFTRPACGTNNLTRYVATPAGRYVLRICPPDRANGQLVAEHQLVAMLTADGVVGRLPFAVPVPVPTPSGDTLVELAGLGTACLLTYIPGERPDPHDPHALRTVGAAYATVDVALAALPQGAVHAALPDWRRGLTALHPLAADPAAWAAALPAAALSADLRAWLPHWLAVADHRAGEHRQRLPIQLVHGDPGLSNVLVAEGRVTGVIDFEFAGTDVRVADLADALSMLVDDWSDPVEQARAAQLCAGYAAVSRLTAEEIAAVPDRLRLRAAGSLVWRVGCFQAGHATTAEVADCARAAYQLEQWLAGNERHLVDLVLRWSAL